ncbi:hypothetical protein [Pseudoduganella sp. GCM10020061]|uniref:hypothetical protein n=1 Tax=Pseudoduganella sp. GCM10020061 TaxID=3317345 RepID=UPI003631091E
MLLDIGRYILMGISSLLGAVFCAFLLLFAAAGLLATLREVWSGKVAFLFISLWFAGGLYGIYRAILSKWNLFSYLVIAISAIIWFYFNRVTKSSPETGESCDK